MAGGEGARLRPLTCNIPKPMMPILDKPVMEYALELLKSHGIKDIAVTLQYLPDEIIRYFGDGKDFGVSIRYFIEEFPLGTAGSIKNAADYIDDTFIVISGDALTDINLTNAIGYHRKKGSAVTVVLKEVPVPLEYGIVVTNKDGKVASFLEKPGWSEVFSDKVNTGIYILEPEVLNYIEKNQKFDFSSDLFPILLNLNKSVFGYVTEEYWCDIGSISQYMRCQYDILKGIVKVKIKEQKYDDQIWIGENCEISPSAKIVAPVFIGRNCNIYADTEIGPFSILGHNNIISTGSVIRRSIIFDNCYIGSNAEIKGAVISSKVQLESKVSIFEECTIAQETYIGERTIVKPGIKVWPNKVFESGALVNTNVIWGGKISRSIFGKAGISGEVNVDITPEFVSKLATAYGSLFNPDSKIAISCSGSEAAEMLKYSLITGLISIGIEVYDLKRMTTAMTRQAVVFFGVQGAVHVSVDSADSQKVSIVFMDQKGLDIDRNLQRKIENSFLREDYRRIKTDGFKKITEINNCIDYYMRQLINQLGVTRIRSRKLLVLLSIDNSLILSILEQIFFNLGINMKLLNYCSDVNLLRTEVVSTSAQCGIIIKNESITAIVDDKGNIIKDELLDAFRALVILKSVRLGTLVVPVTASAVMEHIADICGVKLIRTKSTQKNILEAYLKNERVLSRRDIITTYLMSLDEISLIALTLNFISSSNRSLAEVISQIPKLHSNKIEISCPWDMKGKVMRCLIEENYVQSVDMIEGIRLNYDNSWAVVIPDADEPICRIHTEAKTEYEANKLQESIVSKILSLLDNK